MHFWKNGQKSPINTLPRSVEAVQAAKGGATSYLLGMG
tara:strand:- start:49 stop:162 length:114 start_codon:yes stop_codon:yes gene_type:complete